MTDHTHFDRASHDASAQQKLALWLQHLLTLPVEEEATSSSPTSESSSFEIPIEDEYHPEFYQQLPDFIMALLNNDAQATVRYAPLLFHLAGCRSCHAAYLELYDPLRAALEIGDERPTLPVSYGTRSWAAIPNRVLIHLCQLLISQAEAELRRARRDHTNADESARSLLQFAMKISTYTQSGSRGQALKDLVRVATLFGGPTSPPEPAAHAYSPVLAGAGDPRHGRVVRRAEVAVRSSDASSGQNIIYLQAKNLVGTITQRDTVLELHLHDLEPALRGGYLQISVPLGALIEPVQWIGGDPRAIRSATPVDEQGKLTTPLGQTELRLSNPEDRALLEVMFSLLEVRPA